jgi:hypothetical protein
VNRIASPEFKSWRNFSSPPRLDVPWRLPNLFIVAVPAYSLLWAVVNDSVLRRRVTEKEQKVTSIKERRWYFSVHLCVLLYKSISY